MQDFSFAHVSLLKNEGKFFIDSNDDKTNNDISAHGFGCARDRL